MWRACLCWLIVFFGVVTSRAEGQDVLREFRKAAARLGWLLADFGVSKITILNPVTDQTQSLQLRASYSVYRFGSSTSGDCVAFALTSEILDSSDLKNNTVLILRLDGSTRYVKGHFATIKGIAVSPDCREVVIDGVYQHIDSASRTIHTEGAGLFLADATSDHEDVRVIAGLNDGGNYLFGISEGMFQAGWSANGNALVYSMDKMVYVYDVLQRRSRSLVSGRRASYSPDGKWIGYQAFDGTPMLFNIATQRSEPLVRGAKCLWSIKWSPDAKFVLFTDRVGTGTVFRVCRLTDRAVAAFYQTGAQYLETRFTWVKRSLIDVLAESGEHVSVP